MENKQIASQYLIDLYNEVNYLNANYSTFRNLVIEFTTTKNGSEGTIELNDAERATMGQTIQAFRHFANLTFIRIQSLKKYIPTEEIAALEKEYNAIKSPFIIKTEIAAEYVIRLNSIIATSIIGELLESGKNLYNEVYGGNRSE